MIALRIPTSKIHPMKSRTSITAFALSALLALGTCGFLLGGSTACAQTAAVCSNPLTNMSVGQSQRYASDLKVTFLAVKNDSRCPLGVFCITAGDAEVELRVKVGDNPAKNVSIHTNRKPQTVTLSVLTPGAIGIPKSYTLHVSELTPRRIGVTLKQSDYRLSLGVQTAQ